MQIIKSRLVKQSAISNEEGAMVQSVGLLGGPSLQGQHTETQSLWEVSIFRAHYLQLHNVPE